MPRISSKTFRSIALCLLASCLSFFSLLAGEQIECKNRIEAFDAAEPSRLLGYFDAKSKLELGEYLPSAKMFAVKFIAPDGTEVNAFCKPEDLGKAAPTNEASAKSSAPKETLPAAGSDTPQIFEAIQAFDPTLWETTSSKFGTMNSNPTYGFKWVSGAQNDVSRSAKPLSFLKLPSLESIVRFKADKLVEASLLIYGRGDVDRELDKAKFEALKAKAELAIDEWLGGKGVSVANVDNNVFERKSWFKLPLRVDLEWSVTQSASSSDGFGMPVRKGFRAEFLRLVISSYDGKTSIAELTKPNYQTPRKRSTKLKDLKEYVKQETNGDVYLDGFPMVDQGQKGYCSVASAERVMRYLGLDFDQNELAKVANSASQEGTSTEAMVKALKKLGGQYSLSIRPIKDFTIEDFIKEIDSYNRLAKKAHVETIELGSLISISQIYQAMDPEVFRQTRLKNLSDKNNFNHHVIDLVDRGCPALWSVMLGLVTENPPLPQAFGGHMRLIIGYNKKTSLLIYTDSWGKGHEFKHMSLDDAYVITRGLYSVMPTS